jgi:sulfonate transport system permease protein
MAGGNAMNGYLTRLRRAADPRGLVPLALLLGLWIVAGHGSGAKLLQNGSIGEVLKTGRELIASGALWENYSASLMRVIAGFAIGGSLGIVIGLLLGISVWLDRLFGPLLTALRQVPIFGLVPLLGLWFGMGESAKLALVALAAFFPMALNTHESVRNIPATYREVASLYRFGLLHRLRFVLVPYALPGLLTGLKLALSFAWIAVIGAELFLSAAPGLGNLLAAGREQFRLDLLALGIILVGGTGWAMNAAVTALERYLLRWRPAFS